MKSAVWILSTFLFVAATPGCHRSPPPNLTPSEGAWVYPPQHPRIRHVQTIARPYDIGIRPGTFSRLISGLFGSRETRLRRPHGLVADDGTLYVVDREQGRVHCFDLLDRRYRTLPREWNHVLLSPIDVAVDHEGYVYVTDSALRSVFRFDPQGDLSDVFKPNFLERPTGIAYDRYLERLYVADTIRHCIHVFSRSGEHLFSFGVRGSRPGQLNYPVSLAMTPEGDIVVDDAMNFRIQRFGPDGEFIDAFGKAGDRPGCFSKPKGVAVDSSGRIFVVDALFGNVQIFDPSGRVLLVFGETGSGTGQFSLPTGIAVDRNDRIYVSDSYNSRVQVFEIIGEDSG